MSIAVFSVGNSLMADDGIAEAVLTVLARNGVPDGVRLINAAGDPLRIAQEAQELDLAIVIDCADMDLSPGEVRTFRVDEARFPYEQKLLSNHGIGLAQVIEIMKAMGIADCLCFVGIQPFRIEATPHLSAEMERLVDKAAGQVIDIIRQYDS